jgi:Ser-tRNA(Ala) deacylase AlaX
MKAIYGYEREPYTRELEVTISSVTEHAAGYAAILDDTILYPEGGGQPGDRGWLSGVEVSAVEKRDETVIHYLADRVEPGVATLALDWDRRYDHMQQHTAQHLLTRAALDAFGWATRSFHIGPQVSDIELDCAPPTLAAIEALEDAVARVATQARPIRSFRVSPEEFRQLEVRSRGLPAGHAGDIRLVEIQDFDLNTCGGTHVLSTAEIETLKVVSTEPLRGGCRLSWVAGKRVRRRLALHEARNAQLRKLLDTGDEELVVGLQLRLQQLTAERRLRRSLHERLADALIVELVSGQQATVELHLGPEEAELLRPLAERFAQQARHGFAFLTADTGCGCLFALAAGEEEQLDLQRIGGRVAEVLDGRGGGRGAIFQGKCASLAARDQALSLLRSAIG